jgi:hypothetical protein
MREKIELGQPILYWGNPNRHADIIDQALDTMRPPRKKEDELELEDQLRHWRSVRGASEARLPDLQHSVTWAKLAIESRAGEVLAAGLNGALEAHEALRRKFEASGGALCFVRDKLANGAQNRAVSLALRPLHMHCGPI